MKKIINKIFAASLVMFSLVACDSQNEPEAIQMYSPEVGTTEYYENLRAYKRSQHQVAFGWFGGWTAYGPSESKYLRSVPDSVDIISIWGAWANLKQHQIDDMRYVQQTKDIKVTFTVFAHALPEIYEPTDEGTQKYASDLCDSIAKYGYDGLDLDYEPGFGGKGFFIDPDRPNTSVLSEKGKHNMEVFCRALATRIGPASGTGKLFMIDGVPFALNEGLAELFDYGIVQSYSSSGDADLQNRFNNAYNNGWKPGQYIFTENFEDYWRNGGTTDFKDKYGNVMRSLEGMARFQPTQGIKGGCGSYHMEYEYRHADQDYKYLRQAIQIMNPAVK